MSPCSPRAKALLFMFLRPKGLKIVSYVEFTAESKYDMLAKIEVECFSENPFFVTHPKFHKAASAELHCLYICLHSNSQPLILCQKI